MNKRNYVIIDEFTGELHETNENEVFNEVLEDLIKEHSKQIFYSPLGNEITIFYKPVKVVIESYTTEENQEIREKATITTYKNVYYPYSMD